MNNKNEEFDNLSSKYLGQQGSYAVETDKFDSSFLVPMPRKNIRDTYSLTGKEFIGYDIWNCHEATFLLNSGMPLAGTLKIIYPSSSEFMVESKSFKLYLNSFDFCKMGYTVEEAILSYEKQVKLDLEAILNCQVQTKFFESRQEDLESKNDFSLYSDLQNHYLVDLEACYIEDYSSQRNHLRFEENLGYSTSYRLKTGVLRSRCRQTKQKDTGSAYFKIVTKDYTLIHQSLLEQVVSLRNLDEFHEFCAEKLFIDLIRTDKVTDCCVSLLYSRRGSLDINPIRATHVDLLPKNLLDINQLCFKQQNQ